MRPALLAAALALAACSGPSAAPPGTSLPPAAAAPFAAKPAPQRAMWMWTYPYPPAARVIAFAEKQQVKNIFLAVLVSGGKVESPAAIAGFAKAAKAAGIALYALNGDPSWITNPKTVVAWEKAVLATGAFAGVHLDTEPNEVAGWKAFGTPGAVAADGPIIREMYAMIAALRVNSPTTHLEMDVEFADGQFTRALGYPTDGYGSFGEALVGFTDELTVMSYRTKATGSNGVADISAPMLALAAAHGKPMRLAIETSQDSYASDTFCGRPPSAVEKMFAAIDVAERASPAYAGTSVEDYLTWAALPRCIPG